jgi:hypothetical protein
MTHGATKAVAVELVTIFYEAIGEISVASRRRRRNLERVLLVVSTLTSGALWVLIAGRFQNVAAWVGAAASTLVSGLTLYQATLGPGREVPGAEQLYQDVGKYLASLASKPFDEADFRESVAGFESRLRRIDTEHPIVNAPAMLTIESAGEMLERFRALRRSRFSRSPRPDDS